MVDAPPGDVGDVQQAVDAAEVHERAVVGDVLDHAVDDLALFEVLHQLLALLGAGLFQDGAARDNDVAAAAVHLEDLERLRLTFISGPTSRIGRMSTCERGRKATAPSRSTVKPPFTWLKMTPDDLLVVLEGGFELAPAFLAPRLVARQHGFAQRVLDPLQVDLDGVADLEVALPARAGKFPQRRRGLRSWGRRR